MRDSIVEPLVGSNDWLCQPERGNEKNMTKHPSIKTVYYDGKWWCKHFGVTGCGSTPEAAETDMWTLYRDAVGIGKPPVFFPPKIRA